MMPQNKKRFLVSAVTVDKLEEDLNTKAEAGYLAGSMTLQTEDGVPVYHVIYQSVEILQEFNPQGNA